MSLVAAVSRIAIVNALEGRVDAGQILNAPKEPLDKLKDKAVIAVYTGAIRFDPQGRDLYGAVGSNQTMELVIQITLPPGEVIVDGLEFTMQDAGAGLAMDLIWRQIVNALADPTNPWGEFYKLIFKSFSSVNSQPVLIENERGLRFPCREISIGCKVMAEPSAGQPLDHAWQKVDTALRAHADTAPLADTFKALIESPADLPSWRITQLQMGWSDNEIRAAGLAPFDGTETGEAPVFNDVGTTDADRPPDE